MSIAISFTDSQAAVHNVVVESFDDDALPRSYGATGSFSQSANGSSILAGPAFAQKYIWAVSTIITKAEAEQVDALYKAWDYDRAQGLPVAVGILDQTFGGDITTSATFTTAPNYVRAGLYYQVSFGLTEV